MTGPVACLGEAMVEISIAADPENARLGFAGDTLNTAIYLKRSAPGLPVAYVTKLGRDQLSARMVAMMRDEGLDTSLVLESPDRLPGLYAITTDETGERSFLYWRGQSAARDLFRPPALGLDALARFPTLYFSAITLAILPAEDRETLLAWLPAYRAKGGTVAFDSNYRPRLWPDPATARAAVEAAWRQTDIALPSLDDETALFDDAGEAATLARLHSWGVTSGALKRGPKGPVPLDGGPPPPCPAVSKVVDTTAAGDSFNAGYLAHRLTGAPEPAALAAGHTLASKVIQHRGAILPRTDRETR